MGEGSQQFRVPSAGDCLLALLWNAHQLCELGRLEDELPPIVADQLDELRRSIELYLAVT